MTNHNAWRCIVAQEPFSILGLNCAVAQSVHIMSNSIASVAIGGRSTSSSAGGNSIAVSRICSMVQIVECKASAMTCDGAHMENAVVQQYLDSDVNGADSIASLCVVEHVHYTQCRHRYICSSSTVAVAYGRRRGMTQMRTCTTQGISRISMSIASLEARDICNPFVTSRAIQPEDVEVQDMGWLVLCSGDQSTQCQLEMVGMVWLALCSGGQSIPCK